jgi:hypothetical protein
VRLVRIYPNFIFKIIFLMLLPCQGEMSRKLSGQKALFFPNLHQKFFICSITTSPVSSQNAFVKNLMSTKSHSFLMSSFIIIFCFAELFYQKCLLASLRETKWSPPVAEVETRHGTSLQIKITSQLTQSKNILSH